MASWEGSPCSSLFSAEPTFFDGIQLGKSCKLADQVADLITQQSFRIMLYARPR